METFYVGYLEDDPVYGGYSYQRDAEVKAHTAKEAIRKVSSKVERTGKTFSLLIAMPA